MALVVVSVLLAACQNNAAGGPVANGSEPNVTRSLQITPEPLPIIPEPTPAILVVSPADGATGVLPDARIRVRAASGTLRAVTLVDARGEKIRGQVGTRGTWETKDLLRPATVYVFALAATGPDGTATTTRSTFTTLKPKVKATYTLIPRGDTVGVGMPVIVQFDSAVTTRSRRAEVERRVKVTTAPVQRGAWGWLDNRQLMWRPRDYWVPGSKVSVSTSLRGVRTGENKWVMEDDRTSFVVGSSMVSSVDMRTHILKVRRNGVVVRSFPVSTGKPGPLTETRFGTKVIIDRSSDITMDSATVGIPKGHADYYKIKTKWALRLTWTGEYIHSAPWSVRSQGTANVSHGCTNMAPADAEWMFNNSRMGDLVRFTGSNRGFQPTEGIGVWVYDYARWKAQSALAGVRSS